MVVFEQYRILFLTRTVVTFIRVQIGVPWSYFIPVEPDPLRRALTGLGWPVQVQRHGIFAVQVLPELGSRAGGQQGGCARSAGRGFGGGAAPPGRGSPSNSI
jgi:hypothetical protein